MWTDKCHKCGRNIYNGIPDEHKDRIGEYINEREAEGWFIGQNTRMVETYGMNYKDVSCKPICKICKKEEQDIKNAKETKKAIRKLSKIIKKEFSCPICEDFQKHGYDIKVFKTQNKTEIMKHIQKEHTLSEIQAVLPSKGDY